MTTSRRCFSTHVLTKYIWKLKRNLHILRESERQKMFFIAQKPSNCMPTNFVCESKTFNLHFYVQFLLIFWKPPPTMLEESLMDFKIPFQYVELLRSCFFHFWIFVVVTFSLSRSHFCNLTFWSSWESMGKLLLPVCDACKVYNQKRKEMRQHQVTLELISPDRFFFVESKGSYASLWYYTCVVLC